MSDLNKNVVSVPVFAVESIEVLGKQCLDTGTCHHGCEKTCFRKEGGSPLSVSETWLNEDWTIKI